MYFHGTGTRGKSRNYLSAKINHLHPDFPLLLLAEEWKSEGNSKKSRFQRKMEESARELGKKGKR